MSEWRRERKNVKTVIKKIINKEEHFYKREEKEEAIFEWKEIKCY